MDWPAMVLLGAYHGINPGMGWLFAVALGMQQGSARGVWRALTPMAMGHAAAVGMVLFAALALRLVVPGEVLNLLVASLLLLLGGYRLWRHRHPRFGGMQVGFRDLTGWSFLMASAHGAGLMVLPFVIPGATVAAAAHEHAGHMAPITAEVAALAISIHTLAYFTVMLLVALVVYQRLGLRLLRQAWFNLDWVWAAALVATGVVVLIT